jgi:hypothetical protein
MTSDTHVIGISTVEDLIRLRRSPRFDDTCDEVVALAAHGLATPEQTAAAVRHLEVCPLCRESVLALGGFDASTKAKVPQSPEVPVDGAPQNRSTRRVVLAAAALLAGIAAVLLLSRPWTERPRPGEGLSLKGPADRLQIAVRRNGARFTAQPMSRLVEGDRLGMFYSADRPGYLAVFDIDGDGKVTPLYPSGRDQSAPIPPGEAVPLKDGAVVRDGRGCEWIAAVFSNQPLDMARLEESLGHAERRVETCGLTADIPEARQVRILPFKR